MCTACFGPTITECTACIDGWFIDDTECKICLTGCLTCSDTYDNCQTCDLESLYYKYEDTCLLCEVEGKFFYEGETCIPCDERCATCEALDDCQSCEFGFAFVGTICEACHDYCIECSEASDETKCLKCLEPNYFLDIPTNPTTCTSICSGD